MTEDQYPGCYFYFINREDSECESIDRIAVQPNGFLRGSFTFVPGAGIDKDKCPVLQRRSQWIAIEYDLYLGKFRMILAGGTIGRWVVSSGRATAIRCDAYNQCTYYDISWSVAAFDLQIPPTGTAVMDHEWHDSGWTGDAYVGMLETYYQENTEVWEVPMDLKILKSCLPRPILPGRSAIPGDYVNGRASLNFKFPASPVQGHPRIQALIAWLNNMYINLSQSMDPTQFQAFGGNYYIDGYWYQDSGGVAPDRKQVRAEDPSLPISTFYWDDGMTEYAEDDLQFHYNWSWTPTGILNEGTLEFFGEFPDGPADTTGEITPGFYFNFTQVAKFAAIPPKLTTDGPAWIRELNLFTTLPGNIIHWHLPKDNPVTTIKCQAIRLFTYRSKRVVPWPTHALIRFDVPTISVTGPPDPVWDVLGPPDGMWWWNPNDLSDGKVVKYPPFYNQIAHPEKELQYGYIMRNGQFVSEFQGVTCGREKFEVDQRYRHFITGGCVGYNSIIPPSGGGATISCVGTVSGYTDAYRYVSTVGLTGTIKTMTSKHGVRYKLDLQWDHGLLPMGPSGKGDISFLRYLFESDFPARVDKETGESVPEGFSDIIPYKDGEKMTIPLISKYLNPATGLKETRDRPFPTPTTPDSCTQGLTIPSIELEVLITNVSLPPEDRP